ncbi:probable lipid phosphate phosphatase beta isoform X1 [Citrus sinensis]|uniref:probable lipid phosphate phosphatase beta isoform X1 n=2 Tax=Citrus sinensis TaxID=2711 RepID=UPI0022788064|nr:probable lipid phosphate phosphatase beta isoform X1 [Citrus sinensis]
MAPTTAATKSTSFHHRIITLDAAVSKSIHTLFHTSIPGSLLLLLEYSADFRFSFPLALSLYFTRVRRPYLIQFLVGLLVDLLFVGLVKSIFRRSRPLYNPDMKPAVSVDHFSFPSGHASRVFFVASFISLLDDFSGNCWLVLGVWTWAVLTSCSRVLLGRHFVSDVLAGACLGVLEAAFVFRFLKRLKWKSWVCLPFSSRSYLFSYTLEMGSSVLFLTSSWTLHGFWKNQHC